MEAVLRRHKKVSSSSYPPTRRVLWPKKKPSLSGIHGSSGTSSHHHHHHHHHMRSYSNSQPSLYSDQVVPLDFSIRSKNKRPSVIAFGLNDIDASSGNTVLKTRRIHQQQEQLEPINYKKERPPSAPAAVVLSSASYHDGNTVVPAPADSHGLGRGGRPGQGQQQLLNANTAAAAAARVVRPALIATRRKQRQEIFVNYELFIEDHFRRSLGDKKYRELYPSGMMMEKLEKAKDKNVGVDPTPAGRLEQVVGGGGKKNVGVGTLEAVLLVLDVVDDDEGQNRCSSK